MSYLHHDIPDTGVPIRKAIKDTILTMRLASEKFHTGGMKDRGMYLEGRSILKRLLKRRNESRLFVTRDMRFIRR